MEEFIKCPADEINCPYYIMETGICKMYPKYDPREECDAFYFLYEEEDEEDD